MSASPSTAAAAPSKAQNGQASRQGSQAPRVNNGAQSGARKPQNGSPKTDASRRSPQASANGKQAQNKQQTKPKATPGMSEYLRQRGATVEVANMVGQIRSELGGYFSEELVYNTLLANNNNADSTRTALNQSKTTSWASKVGPAASSSAAVPPYYPAPSHITQGPRPRKVKATAAAAQKPASPGPAAETVAAVPEPAVDPEQMEKSLESALQATHTQAQELIGLQTSVSTLRASQTELSTQKETLLQRIAQHEAEIAKDRATIQSIDSELSTTKTKLAELQKTISLKTAKQ